MDERTTPRRPSLPNATNVNATLHARRDSRGITVRTLYNEPWLDVDMVSLGDTGLSSHKDIIRDSPSLAPCALL